MLIKDEKPQVSHPPVPAASLCPHSAHSGAHAGTSWHHSNPLPASSWGQTQFLGPRPLAPRPQQQPDRQDEPGRPSPRGDGVGQVWEVVLAWRAEHGPTGSGTGSALPVHRGRAQAGLGDIKRIWVMQTGWEEVSQRQRETYVSTSPPLAAHGVSRQQAESRLQGRGYPVGAGKQQTLRGGESVPVGGWTTLGPGIRGTGPHPPSTVLFQKKKRGLDLQPRERALGSPGRVRATGFAPRGANSQETESGLNGLPDNECFPGKQGSELPVTRGV